jgi:hypothetical protein
VDNRTDQFSLGLILHEMASGRPAFRRDTPAQVLAAVIERDPEPLRRVRQDAPEALEVLVARCLRKDPQARFPRTDDLAAELAVLAGRSRSVSVEVLPAVAQAPAPAAAPVYHVHQDDKVRDYDEAELIELLRGGKLTGAELVRRDDEEEWQPLFESRIYRREVPWLGDPRDAARRRVLRGLAGHFSGFFITGVVMVATTGEFPFWMSIWGAVLLVQILGSLPAAWALLRRRIHDARAEGRSALPAREPAAALPAQAAPLSPVAQEAARVRALIEQRGGKDTARLLAEVDGILKLTTELGARETDLSEQTSERERVALTAAVADARGRLERAELAQDRRLFERQLEVLQGRQEAIAKAMRVLDRLRVRRELAEHQLKQLRLDLSRGAASGLDVPELSSRLEFIRYEVDAREEIEEIGADRE